MAGSGNKVEILFLEPWQAEMRLSVLFLLPGVSCTSVLICRVVCWWLWCSSRGWRLVLPQGHKQKVVCASPHGLQPRLKGSLWAAPRAGELRAQTVPCLTGKVLCPKWHQMKRNRHCPIALLETTLLLKRDDYRVRQQSGGDLRTIQMLFL